jgi:hypothetical protein
MLKLSSISPSRIKTFDTCKFKYWLSYHTNLPLKSNWGAAHGSLLHDLLENYANGDDVDWTSRLYRGYGGILDTLDRYGNQEIMESPLVWAKSASYHDKKPLCDTCPFAADDNTCSISRESLSSLTGCPRDLFEGSINMMEDTLRRYEDTFKKILKDKDGNLIGTEYNFNLPITGTDVPMIGIMDLVIEEDQDTIHVIDYKTGSWTQNYKECCEDIQVQMYDLAAYKEFVLDASNKGYQYKNVMLTFDYFTKDSITLAFDNNDRKKVEDNVLSKINEIQSTDWINRIVRSNDEFSERRAWKCRSLCDTKVCAHEWTGNFKASEAVNEKTSG